jgi:hypothetical protein
VKKKVRKYVKSGKEVPQPPKSEEIKIEVDPTDFGGLPKRDLKKNLGCG